MPRIISPQHAADKPKPKARTWNGTPDADTVALDIQAAAVAEFFRAADVSPAGFFQQFDPLEVQPFAAFNATYGRSLGLELIYCRSCSKTRRWAYWIDRPLELPPSKLLQRHQPDSPDRLQRAVVVDAGGGLVALGDGERPQVPDGEGCMVIHRDPKWWVVSVQALAGHYGIADRCRAIMRREPAPVDLDPRLPKRRRPRSHYPQDLDPLQHVWRSPGDSVYVRRTCLQAINHLPSAIVLSQLVYWLTPRKVGELPRARAELRRGRDIWWPTDGGRVWGLTATYRRLQDQTGLTYEQIKDAMRRLREGKWIVTRTIATRWQRGLEIIPAPRLQELVELNHKAGTLVPRSLLGLLSITQSLVFCRLAWWFGNNAKTRCTRAWSRRVRDEEVYHVAFPHAELAEQLGLTTKQVRGAVEALQKLGIVIAKPHLRGKTPVTHYRIDYGAFLRLYFSRFTQNTEQ